MNLTRTLTLLVAMMSAAVASATPTNYLFPSSFTAQTTGEWSLNYAPSNGNPTSMTPMSQSGGSFYTPGSPFAGRPTYNEYGDSGLRFSGFSNSQAFVVFTAPQAGDYSVDLRIFSEAAGLQTYACQSRLGFGTLINGVYTEKGNQTSTWLKAGNNNLYDIAALPTAQNLSLQAGDKIVFTFLMQQTNNYDEVVMRFQNSDSTPLTSGANISFVAVPEPITLGLLSIGGMLLMRRKK